MKRISIFTIILLMANIIYLQKVYSNGGPLDNVSIKVLGRHNFKNVETVQLVKEDLNITILGEFIKYDVNYEFLNTGEEIKVDYGFPIEFTNEWSQDQHNPNTKEIIASFVINDNGNDLKYSTSFEKLTTGRGEDDYPRWNEWFRTKINFQKKEQKKLRIVYTIKATNDDMIFTKSFIPEYSLRTTTYTFSGAKYWGDGKAGSVNITIDGSALEKTGGKIESIEPKGYANKGNIFTKEYQDISIGSIPKLIITYNNEKGALTDYIKDFMIPIKTIKSIKASSTLEDPASGNKMYDVKNLFDGSSDTAWVTKIGDSGKGVTIEVKLADSNIMGIGILNGYLKSEKTFAENGKITSVYVSVGNENGVRQTDLSERNYKDFNPNAPASFIDWIFKLGDGYQEANKIVIFIESASPGTKYKEMAISELFIVGRPLEAEKADKVDKKDGQKDNKKDEIKDNKKDDKEKNDKQNTPSSDLMRV